MNLLKTGTAATLEKMGACSSKQETQRPRQRDGDLHAELQALLDGFRAECCAPTDTGSQVPDFTPVFLFKTALLTYLLSNLDNYPAVWCVYKHNLQGLCRVVLEMTRLTLSAGFTGYVDQRCILGLSITKIPVSTARGEADFYDDIG